MTIQEKEQRLNRMFKIMDVDGIKSIIMDAFVDGMEKALEAQDMMSNNTQEEKAC